ncbi:MAG: DNA repair protein RecO [Candidatus Marinimicrobia bacterium]|jgi:DNA repair protein RecO|nr:DNA repair protein RecO [Candidatus Neomarinimicrobiota bacterium]|tara:strand:+ start:122 stop:808 length:687 start_codon:yes stop_codon:yes gene_type:complete
MIVHTEAVVLKRFPFGETSMIARCLTRGEGKVSVMVRGAKKKKPHYISFFQPINYLDLIYHFKPKRSIQITSKVTYQRIWSKYQNNLKHMSYGLALMEITDKATINNDPHPDLFDELVSVLHKMDTQENRLNILFWYYEMKLLTLLGFKPNLSTERIPEATFMDPDGSPNSRDILEALQNHSLNSIPDLSITAKDRKTVGAFLTGYIRYYFDYSGPLHSFEFMKKLNF